MKFNQGHWRLLPGTEAILPVTVAHVELDADALIVTGYDHTIHHRSNYLHGTVITARFSSPMPGVIRVQQTHFKGRLPRLPAFDLDDSLNNPNVTIGQDDQNAWLDADGLKVIIPLNDGWHFKFERDGQLLTESEAGAVGLFKQNGETYLREQLSLQPRETVYGLGERFGAFVKNGQAVDMWNEDGGTDSEYAYKNIPFYLTSQGYGVLVNHPGNVAFEVASHHVTRVQFSAAEHSLDYYLFGGPSMKDVLGQYTALSGRPPKLPDWSFGLWLTTSFTTNYDEASILANVSRMAEWDIPISVFHFDCFWMKELTWCSFIWDERNFPDPAGMIHELHNRYHTHFMISVWPKFYTGTKAFKEFWNEGWLYKKNVEDRQKDWVGYVSTFYDAFNPEARKAFWELVNKKIFSKGVDAWWLDATEPDILSNTSIEKRKQLMDPTALGPSMEYFNAYPLENAKAFYNGQRNTKPNQRVFILTRSAFAGSQRYAAATWSGDIGATWQDMKNQIATGTSFSLSGIPYWTMDIGGFATEARYQRPDAANEAEWREQMTRWYQFGAFCPLFRAHGQLPYREIFNVAPEGSPAYQSMLYYDRLRYRLLPYIYSLAGAVYRDGYTIMRGLVMDFASDSTARNITDEYLFGPDLLINPVCEYRARTRNVYLPAGTGWYDFYTGKYFAGGKTISADAPYTRMPVFVKAGSIIPFGPALEYTQHRPADTITLRVYTGQDGHFDLYEDDGLTYAYEKGACSIIPMEYNEAHKTLVIGGTEGSFTGMLQRRVFRVVWEDPGHPVPLDFDRSADQIIPYDGHEITISMKK